MISVLWYMMMRGNIRLVLVQAELVIHCDVFSGESVG